MWNWTISHWPNLLGTICGVKQSHLSIARFPKKREMRFMSCCLIADESSGLDWRTCYKIIKGVCFGLHYLHEECRPQNNNASIIHLDLKPANILLDENMVPKVVDFSLSKFLYDTKTQTCPVEGTL